MPSTIETHKAETSASAPGNGNPGPTAHPRPSGSAVEETSGTGAPLGDEHVPGFASVDEQISDAGHALPNSARHPATH